MLNVNEWMKLASAALGGSTMAIMILLILYNDAANNDSNLSTQNGGNGLGEVSTMATLGLEVTTKSDKALLASTCRKTVMILAKRMMKHLTFCHKELKKQYPEPDDFNKHFQCAIRCFLRRVNLVDEEFRMTNETIFNFMSVQIPERFQKTMYSLGQSCLDIYMPKLDGSDPLCTQHGDLIKCLQNSMSDSC